MTTTTTIEKINAAALDSAPALPVVTITTVPETHEQAMARIARRADVTITNAAGSDLWENGYVTCDDGDGDVDFHFSAKVFAEPSVFGIGFGRISKLMIWGAGQKLVVNYDRGWDRLPATPGAMEALQFIVAHYSGAAKPSTDPADYVQASAPADAPADAPAVSAEYHDVIDGKVIFSFATARRGDKAIATAAELDSWLAAAAERHGATAGACVAIDCDDAAYGAACRLLELAGFEPEDTDGDCGVAIYDRNC